MSEWVRERKSERTLCVRAFEKVSTRVENAEQKKKKKNQNERHSTEVKSRKKRRKIEVK